MIPLILKRAKQFEFDIIEVVGHTDEMTLNNRMGSNLDYSLIPFLWGQSVVLSAKDNTGLGMARAAAVVRILLANKSVAKKFVLRPLSAGQTMLRNGKLSKGKATAGQKNRRRIEIRLRRSPKAKAQRVKQDGSTASNQVKPVVPHRSVAVRRKRTQRVGS